MRVYWGNTRDTHFEPLSSSDPPLFFDPSAPAAPIRSITSFEPVAARALPRAAIPIRPRPGIGTAFTKTVGAAGVGGALGAEVGTALGGAEVGAALGAEVDGIGAEVGTVVDT